MSHFLRPHFLILNHLCTNKSSFTLHTPPLCSLYFTVTTLCVIVTGSNENPNRADTVPHPSLYYNTWRTQSLLLRSKQWSWARIITRIHVTNGIINEVVEKDLEECWEDLSNNGAASAKGRKYEVPSSCLENFKLSKKH